VVALAGYADPPNHPPLAFSIVLNQAGTPIPQLRNGLDAIVLELIKLVNCDSP